VEPKSGLNRQRIVVRRTKHEHEVPEIHSDWSDTPAPRESEVRDGKPDQPPRPITRAPAAAAAGGAPGVVAAPRRQRAYWGAAYGSSCASYPTDWAGISNVPAAISPSGANASDPNGGLDNGSAYGHTCLNDGLWPNDQRVGQFSYDTSDANGNPLIYNGVHLPAIDENCADSYLPSKFGTESNTCRDID